MLNHKEVLEALLAGETLVDLQDKNISLRLDGNIIIDEVLRKKSNIILGSWEIKPKTININGFEVPEPVRKPLDNGESYYLAGITKIDSDCVATWHNNLCDYNWLQKGLIHLTKEAAILHTKALLSFTEKNDVSE
jgi:hypothetical protein